VFFARDIPSFTNYSAAAVPVRIVSADSNRMANLQTKFLDEFADESNGSSKWYPFGYSSVVKRLPTEVCVRALGYAGVADHLGANSIPGWYARNDAGLC
jgi:hypothetical protein